MKYIPVTFRPANDWNSAIAFVHDSSLNILPELGFLRAGFK